MMLPDVIHRHAASSPHRPAVVADRRLTYRDLDTEAALVAAALHGQGVKAGSLVTVYLPRCADVLVAIAGVLGSGSAYTIVEDDGKLAEQITRIGAIGGDAVITTPHRAGSVAGCAPIVTTIEELRQPPAGAPERREHLPAPDDPAYVLFTSGSTGSPKGVVVTHANIRHYATSLLARLGIRRPLGYAHVSTLAADLGNTCLFLPLYSGGCVHLVDDARRRDPSALLSYLHAEGVDVLKITPSHWRAISPTLAGLPDRRLLRLLILGGEVLALGQAREILASGVTGTLVNHYGPTETTVGVSTQVLSELADVDELASASVPIGTPLGDTVFLVADPGSDDYRTEGVGELFIGGPSVAAGYLRDPDATRESFLGNLPGALPSGPLAGRRFYRSGDLVRIGPDGVAEFLGRRDRQVKINGYRVELDHVETAVRRLDGVLDAAAFLLDAGDRTTLAAAVATRTGTETPGGLRGRLAGVLPHYLVPARIVESRGALPLNGNGKPDLARIRLLTESAGAEPAPARPAASTVPAEIHGIWRRYLGSAYTGEGTDFFATGGSSLDAIGLIGDYQALGYPVTAQSFLADPTPHGVQLAIARGSPDDDRPGAGSQPESLRSNRFSAAQQWFFAQEFAQPHHWNQTVLLEAAADVDTAALAAAVRDVVDLHPLLRTAYQHGLEGWQAAALPPGGDVFSVSRFTDPASLTDHSVAQCVRQAARKLHASISLERGEVFKAHLVSLANHPDQLLLVCHHLSIDAVSWRILIGDLVRSYGARLRGTAPHPPYESLTFWDWVRSGAAGDLRPPAPHRRRAGGNLEGGAQTVWLAFTPYETVSLTRALPERTGVPLHAAILGAFLHALAPHRGANRFLVDVEGHGRTTGDDRVDVSRVIGWFTSTVPARLPVVAGDAMATIKGVSAALDGLTGAPPDRSMGPAPQPEAASPMCYNFLGPFDFPPDESLRLSASSLPIGPARGDANDRIYELKLTARIVADQLALDLSFHPSRDDQAALVAAMRHARTLLLELSGLAGGTSEPLLTVERGSSSGLLTYLPARLRLGRTEPASVRTHQSVLLTGATGFIGVHLLQSMLARTTTHVRCLVRGEDDAAAAARLAATYEWYFGEPLTNYACRWSVHAGDVTDANLGLAPAVYRMLCAQVGAIYHCAGETRLFGHDAAVLHTNVESVRAMIRMARSSRQMELHFLSSLAVAGTNTGAQPLVFSEDSLDVGQQFQNAYELSKYMGERLVHQFQAEGGAGFIYRTGNVSGHSRSSRFQRNAADNRLVQELRAILRIGRRPQGLVDALVLDPVDTVAESILAISRCGWLTGGTFHVENPYQVAYRDLLHEVSRLVRPLPAADAGSIADLLACHAEQDDPVIRLGRFWTSRPPRNVRFDHTRSQRLLAGLGVAFAPLGRDWLRRFVTHLADEGHLQRVEGAGWEVNG